MTHAHPFIRVFAPELWGQVDRFKQFYATTHDFKPSEKKAVAGVDNHFNKTLTLNNLTAKLAPNLRLIQEMPWRARSTRNLFERAAKGELCRSFPEPLLSALQTATWFNELRAIRDELTRSTIGASRPDSDTNTNEISDVHHGVQRNNAPLVIDNGFKKIDKFARGVNEFLGSVLHFLNAGLKAEPVDIVCAFSFDRVYMRKMTIADQVDFNSGVCQSNHWFDQESGRQCPFADGCAAYAAAKGGREQTF